ncbi:hemolysin family protein [Chlamydiia bacterium]|nr:hemolysin family protein [Chlamydiia bacterium]
MVNIFILLAIIFITLSVELDTIQTNKSLSLNKIQLIIIFFTTGIAVFFALSQVFVRMQSNIHLSRFTEYLVNIINTLLYPISYVLSLLVYNYYIVPTRQKAPAKDLFYHSVSSIIDQMKINKHASYSINKQLLSGFLKFQDLIVKEIMIPRVSVFALDQEMTLEYAIPKIVEKGYTRVPLYKDNIDNIVGVFLVKDILVVLSNQSNENDFYQRNLKTFAKPPLYIPETKIVSGLLQEFKRKHTHMAIVVDEYGGTEGLITIEDILEEFVGDIEDEYDLNEATPFVRINETTYLINATYPLTDLEEKISVTLPKSPDFDTLGGYIISQSGSIPKKGLIIHGDGFDVEVIKVTAKSIEKVKLIVSKVK